MELPGKLLPPLPRKNKSSTNSNLLSVGGGDDDDSSVSSVSTRQYPDDSSLRNLVGLAIAVQDPPSAHRASADFGKATVTLYREDHVSLRAFLRTFLQNQQIAGTKAMAEFLTSQPVSVNEEELGH
jgi:hypothetical protein